MSFKNWLKALVVCNHPGGAHAVFPVVKEFLNQKSRIEFDCFLTTHSHPIFQSLGDLVNIKHVSETLSKDELNEIKLTDYSFVLAGTSIHGNLEKEVIIKARHYNIKTFSILDHWCEYDIRFGEPEEPLNALPDTVFVPDDFACKDLIDIGVPGHSLVISGHPAFDKLNSIKESFSCHEFQTKLKSHCIISDKGIILFISEPVQADHSSKKLGYSEFSVLRSLLEALIDTEMSQNIQLIIKLHPREKIDKFDSLVDEFKSIKIRCVKEELDRFDLILGSKFVIGISSLMLLEAAFLGIPVYSMQNEGDDSSFIGIRNGWVKKLYDKFELERVLKDDCEISHVPCILKNGASNTIFQHILGKIL